LAPGIVSSLPDYSGEIRMWRVTGWLALLIFLVHFYLLAQTGHLEPCNAAFAKLEFETLGTFKNGRRWLVEDNEDRAKLYGYIEQRDILQCYKIALF
jgi:hypothetical protein